MLQKLRSNRSVLSVGTMGTWTWNGPIGPRDQDGRDQSVLEIPLDRVEPIKSVRLDSVQNRSVSVGLGPVQTEVVHTWPRWLPPLRMTYYMYRGYKFINRRVPTFMYNNNNNIPTSLHLSPFFP